MRSATRFAVLSLLVLIMSLAAVPAMGAESGDEDETTSTTAQVNFEYQPATILEPPPPDVAEQPWTTKFLVPTGLALAAVAVFVTVVQYFVRVVRSRYKVVE